MTDDGRLPVVDYQARDGTTRVGGPVVRDGKLLVVNRGADLSAACAVCGRPAVGEGIVRRLSADTGMAGGGFDDPGHGMVGVIMLALMLIQLAFGAGVMWAAWRDRKRRVIVVGLCDLHRRWQRQWARVNGCGGVLMVAGVGGIAAVSVARPHYFDGSAGALIALGIAAFVGILLLVWNQPYPRLRLRREAGERMWVGGFGPAALDRYGRVRASKPDGG